MPTDFIGLGIAFLAAFLLGISKSGVKGLGIFVVTLMALAFDSRSSTGIIMPMLIFGDIFAVIYYKRHVVWSLLFKLLPAMMVGVLIGVWVGSDMDEVSFKRSMSAIILVSVAIMFLWDKKGQVYIPKSPLFAGFCGPHGWFYHYDRQSSWSLFQYLFSSHAYRQESVYRHCSVLVFYH